MVENQNIPGRGTPPKTPGWVKIFFLIITILVVIVVLAHLLGVRFDHGGGATLFHSLASYAYLAKHTRSQA